MRSIDDRGQTDRVTKPTRVGLGRATPHASPRLFAADDVTTKSHCYGHQLLFIGRRSRYSCSTHVFAMTFEPWPMTDFQFRRAGDTNHIRAKSQGQRSVSLKDRVETDGQTDGWTRPIASPSHSLKLSVKGFFKTLLFSICSAKGQRWSCSFVQMGFWIVYTKLGNWEWSTMYANVTEIFRAPYTCILPPISLSQSCPWVGLTRGLGWVGLGRDFSVFGGLGWVGSTTAKILKIWKCNCNAFKARLDMIWLHQAVKFDFMADLTWTGNWSEGVIKW